MYKQHDSEEKPSARLFFCFLNLFVQKKKHDQSFTQAASVPPHRNDNVSNKKKKELNDWQNE